MAHRIPFTAVMVLFGCRAPDPPPSPPADEPESCLLFQEQLELQVDPGSGEGTGRFWIENQCNHSISLLDANAKTHGGMREVFSFPAAAAIPLEVPGGASVRMEVRAVIPFPMSVTGNLILITAEEPHRVALSASWDVAAAWVDGALPTELVAGCERDVQVSVRSEGLQPAVVEGLSVMGLTGPVTSVPIRGSWPVTVAPGQELDVAIRMIPSSSVEVADIKPTLQPPGHSLRQRFGWRVTTGAPVDYRATWRGVVPVDVVFVVDRARPTIQDHIADLASATPAFLARLRRGDADARVLAIIDKLGCPYGRSDYVEPGTSDSDTLRIMSAQLDVVERYDIDDYSLTHVLDTALLPWRVVNTEPGRCTDRWHRTEADLHLVLITDRSAAPDDNWEIRLERLQRSHGELGKVTIHTLFIPSDDECETGKIPADLMSAAEITGGSVSLLCSKPVAEILTDVGDAIVPLLDQTVRTIYLPSEPERTSIGVSIDGVRLPPSSISYDPAARVVHLPDSFALHVGSKIQVKYLEQLPCD